MRLSPRLIAIALCAPLFSSCGTFKLATSVQAPIDRSDLQKETDTLACTHQADLAQNSPDQQVKSFLLGATIVGVPLAHQMERAAARDAFANCMTSRGYSLVMPDGSSRRSAISPSVTAPGFIEHVEAEDEAENIKGSTASSVGMTLPKGWSKAPTPNGIQYRNVLLSANNITSDSGLFLSAFPIDAISNMEEFAHSQASAITSMLEDGKKSDVKRLAINGRDAFRFEISGITNNIRIAFVYTVVKGDPQVAVLNAWTAFDNFPNQRGALEGLAYAVNFSEENLQADQNVGAIPPEIRPGSGLENRDLSYRSGFQPAYPQLAIDTKHEGTATLLALVDEKGDVKAVEIQSTSGYTELDRAAVEAVYGWKFNPAVRNGRYVEGEAKIPINFNLNKLPR